MRILGLAGRLVGIARLARLRVAAECLGHVIDSGDDAIRIESRERRRKRRKNYKCHAHQQFGHRKALIVGGGKVSRALVACRWSRQEGSVF